MNLRNVTIWTTGVMLIMPIAAPFAVTLFLAPVSGFDLLGSIIAGILHYPFGCAPFVISFILARKLKNKASGGILLVSTIACAVWCVIMWKEALCMGEGSLVGTFFGFDAILSLPVMLLAWILAYVLNRRYAKQQEPQV